VLRKDRDVKGGGDNETSGCAKEKECLTKKVTVLTMHHGQRKRAKKRGGRQNASKEGAGVRKSPCF